MRWAGLALVSAPLTVAPLAYVAAQEAELQPTSIDASAIYVASATAVLPKTLTNDVPPTATCIVVPEACPPELDPLRDVARDVVGDVADADVTTPVQPIPPDAIAVSVLTGTTRHQSAIRFQAPTPPPDEEITGFELVLGQTEPTFDMDSPAFRRVILGVFESVGPQDPQFAVDGLIDALQNEAPVELSQKIGIEACPLLAPFDPIDAPQAQSDEALPHDEESGEPNIDCVLGAIGAFDGQALTWTFDLRFAARAWAAGELDNHGVLLRPIGVQNLAYGDPDPTTSAQITLDLASAASAVTSQPLLPPAGAPPTTVGEAPPTLSGGTDFSPGDRVPLGGPPLITPPDTMSGPPVAAPRPTPPADEAVDILPIVSHWWSWLVWPAFLAGIVLAILGFTGTDDAHDDLPPGALAHLGRTRTIAASSPG